jgi:cytochrome c556
MVSPELADAMTVFITMLLGALRSSTMTISPAAPPFMKRQLIKMMMVPLTSMEMFCVSKLRSMLALYDLKMNAI